MEITDICPFLCMKDTAHLDCEFSYLQTSFGLTSFFTGLNKIISKVPSCCNIHVFQMPCGLDNLAMSSSLQSFSLLWKMDKQTKGMSLLSQISM